MSLINEMIQKRPPDNELCIWWLGQEGFVIKSQSLTIYIDPYLSNYAERITKGKSNEHIRMTPAPIKPEEVTNADLVICTHDHVDHIDPEGIPVIAEKSPNAVFLVPRCALDIMLGFGISEERIITLKGNDCTNFKDINIHAIPAKHEQFNEDLEKGYPFLSYVIQYHFVTLLHVGDSIPYEGQSQRIQNFGIDLALVPINGRDEFRHKLNFEGNFTCKEAVEFAKLIQADLTIPMHYDMFTLNTASVEDFMHIADDNQLMYEVLKPGKMFTYFMER